MDAIALPKLRGSLKKVLEPNLFMYCNSLLDGDKERFDFEQNFSSLKVLFLSKVFL